ncbi:MAG: nicotinate phosphoribosyltransferase [Clostridiales bacterium GWE2_32_10]|nr:MAG: nicotinate phosphoribosyltransferase [Clostridiales bacterium GWE2_32_10]
MKFNVRSEENLTMLTDLYQLTMMQIYNEDEKEIGCFDMFFRKNPDKAGFTVFAGLDKVIDYVQNIKFEEDDLNYLRTLDLFDEDFLDYLRDFKFECDVWAMPEGTVVFPNEPLITVRGPAEQAQLVETAVLNIINHQTRIATKAERIVRAADGRPVIDFGLRRAHGVTAAVDGAKASYVAGMAGTSNVLAGKKYGIPVKGTMAHSFVQKAKKEYDAFERYAKRYPDKTVLLVDTYDVLKSGIPNAIKVAKEILEPQGHKLQGIRIDSGDLVTLTKKARKLLDDAGLDYVKITVSNSLDEYEITRLLAEEAPIDSFGVGERNITAKSDPVLGGVYKLTEVEDQNELVTAKIKISESQEKTTNPGFKKVWRVYDSLTNKAMGDVLTLAGEDVDVMRMEDYVTDEALKEAMVVEDYMVKELMVPIFNKGALVYDVPTLEEVRDFCKAQVETLTDGVKKFENPDKYNVDLSDELYELKLELIEEMAA